MIPRNTAIPVKKSN